MAEARSLRWLPVIAGIFVATFLIANVAANKVLQLGPLSVTGGVLVFPLSYILGDVLTEVYGYGRARIVIWTGFLASALMSLIFWLVGVLPAAPFWDNQAAWEAILGLTPRIVLASLVAYFAGEFSNSFTLAKLKILTRGRYLWMRTIASTLLGEGVDTVLFVVLAFGGVFVAADLVAIIASNYLFKVGFEVIATPWTYWVANGLKRAEGVDYFDYATDFNPFRLRE